MSQEKFLYGAAVQGIQRFIFQTNQLKDIVGASEIVENICTKAFDEFGGAVGTFGVKGRSLVRAAGNIKHVFDNRTDCENAVLNFPRKVMLMAPGVEVSQAVVPFASDSDLPKAIEELERKLHVQRNRPVTSVTIGLSGILRSRRTGLPAVKRDKDDYLDVSTAAKRQYVKGAHESLREKFFGSSVSDARMAYDISDLTRDNDWVAIIHADGNSLGQVVPLLAKDEDNFRTFSAELDRATVESARRAYMRVYEKFGLVDERWVPMRPIVLGGDDLTLVCRGDLAMDFVREFLEAFEDKTGEYLRPVFEKAGCSFSCLTACAGVAFIKSSYPFYYGYGLAEELCQRAKTDAKNPKRIKGSQSLSCVMFHKVQDSFVEDYGKMAERELTPQKGMSFLFGPYYLDRHSVSVKDRWTITELMDAVDGLDGKEGNALKSGLRQWMTLLHDRSSAAEQKRDRMAAIIPRQKKPLFEKVTTPSERGAEGGENGVRAYPAYDILAINTIRRQKTK